MDYRYACSILTLLLALGCGDDTSGADDASASPSSGDSSTTTISTATTDGGTDTSSSGGSAGTSPTGSPADSTGTSGEPTTGDPPEGSLGMGHGTVHLRLERSPAETEDPFVDTAQIEVTLLYLECLIDFYQDNPDWTQLGPQGAVVFDAALGSGVCDPENGFVDCTVAELQQQLEVSKQLTVTYDVTQPIEDQLLRFGPLPVQGLAGCVPIVRVSSNGSIIGRDAVGDVIWAVESFFPQEAATDQQAPITVSIARL